MATCQRLRLGDVRAVYKLLGECRELGIDSTLWRIHVFRELCRLTGAKAGIGGEAYIDTGGWITPDPELVVDVGWADDSERRHLMSYYQSGTYRQDPYFQGLVRRGLVPLKVDRRVVTVTRSQIVEDRRWYGSPSFCDYRRHSGIDDGVMSFAPLADGEIHALTVHRALGERPFDERERRLVHLFHLELAPLLGTDLAPPGRDPVSRLAPRLRQVLSCLLEGDTEKQVALRLGVTCDSVHQYVKAVYRGFGVRSRAELMARFVRFPVGALATA